MYITKCSEKVCDNICNLCICQFCYPPLIMQGGCVSVSQVNCSMARLPLISSLDVYSHSELHNSFDRQACNTSMSSSVMHTFLQS